MFETTDRFTPLKEKIIGYRRVGKGSNSGSFRYIYWKMLPNLYTPAKKSKMTVEELAKFIFSSTANIYDSSNDGVRINVSNKNLVGVFNVAMHRTSKFFKDREKTVTSNGRTKPIFHVAKSHLRLVGEKTIPVRMHFKGERKFTWKGYSVNITVPGVHHADVRQLTPAAIDVTNKELLNYPDHIDSKAVGEIIKKAHKQNNSLSDVRSEKFKRA